MNTEQIERLRQKEGKVVKITCSDGESLEAKVLHVDDACRDVIFDLVSSTAPQKYRQGSTAAYAIDFEAIADFE